MKKILLVSSLAVVAAVGSAQVTLYNNGTVINSGTNLSVITSPNTTFGYGSQIVNNNRVADDFVAGANWNLQEISLYSYQTGGTSFTFTGANIEIFKGADIATATSVYSATGLGVTDRGLEAFRVTNTTLGDTTRRIFEVGVDIADMSLVAGETYWLSWSLSGSLASGPWTPQVMNGVQPKLGNGKQSLAGGAWANALWNVDQTTELPFELRGTAVPEPATMLVLAAGAGIAAFRRKKSK